MAFTKNHIPWNKGVKGRKEYMNLSGLELGHLEGEKHHNWKGDNASYSAIHNWVVKQKRKASICVDCGSSKKVEWANISGEYMRDETDFKSLCHSCHILFDRKNGQWGKRTAFFERRIN